MALLDHRVRIAIADPLDSAEHELTHGTVDLAAALVENAWEGTPLAHLVNELDDAFTHAVPVEFQDVHNELEFTRGDALRYGARLGFALARTVAAADRGWPQWLAEAESWLQASGCGTNAHQKTPREYREDFLTEIQEIEASGRWRVASSRPPEERKETAAETEPPASVTSVISQIAALIDDRLGTGLTSLSNAVMEEFAEHERRHHSASAPGPTAKLEPETLTRAARAARSSSVRKG